MKSDTLWIIKVLGIPLFFSTCLAVWFFVFQQRPYALSESLNGTYNAFKNPFIRSISHLSRQHMIGNTIGFFSLSVVLLTVSSTRFYFINFLSIFVMNVVFLALYFTEGVGFSIVLYGVFMVSSLMFIKFEYAVLKSDKASLIDNSNLLFASCFSIVLALYLLALVSDAMIVADIITIDNPSFMEPFVSDKKIYTVKSSQGHVTGAMIGVISFSFWNTVFQRTGGLRVFTSI